MFSKLKYSLIAVMLCLAAANAEKPSLALEVQTMQLLPKDYFIFSGGASPKSKNSFWVAIGLEVLGATAIGLGIYNNANSATYHKESKKLAENVTPSQYYERKDEFDAKYKKMHKAEKTRNIFYAAGSILLVNGIAVHVWF